MYIIDTPFAAYLANASRQEGFKRKAPAEVMREAFHAGAMAMFEISAQVGEQGLTQSQVVEVLSAIVWEVEAVIAGRPLPDIRAETVLDFEIVRMGRDEEGAVLYTIRDKRNGQEFHGVPEYIWRRANGGGYLPI